jgi:hypothetical protein
MSSLHIDSFEHFGQKKISCFLLISLEDEVGDEINVVASDGVGISDQIEGIFDESLLNFSLQ